MVQGDRLGDKRAELVRLAAELEVQDVGALRLLVQLAEKMVERDKLRNAKKRP